MRNLLTDDEYAILKNLEKRWKWITRDEYGSLELFSNKPRKNYGTWGYVGKHGYLSNFDHLFDFIKNEYDEPYEIAQLIDAYETMMDCRF